MTNSAQAHIDQRTGDIDFPLWVKVIGGILGVCTPLGLTLMGWLSLTVVEMKSDLKYATQDRYTGEQHRLYAEGQSERDQRQNDRLTELERLHGRGPYGNGG